MAFQTALAGPTSLGSKFLGGMVGSALGDAIGELAFLGVGAAQLRAEIAQRRVLTYTDDTAMAIGLAQSIAHVGGLDEQHLGDTLGANFAREPWRGYGSGPRTIFSLVRRHRRSYSEVARSLFGGQGSFGNGAAMRITPVGLFFHDAVDLYAQARRSASITHTHPVGVDGAAVLAWAVAEAVRLTPEGPFPLDRFSVGLVEFARTQEIRAKMMLVRGLIDQDAPPAEAALRLGRGVAVHESLPFAVYSFLRHPQSFESCLLCAVLNGGDRDTLGAMACAISGAYLGNEGIPRDWREKLENCEYISELALSLADMKRQ